MVDAYKFERDDVPLKREKLELKDLVAGVLERVRPLAEERGLTLTLRGEGARGSGRAGVGTCTLQPAE